MESVCTGGLPEALACCAEAAVECVVAGETHVAQALILGLATVVCGEGAAGWERAIEQGAQEYAEGPASLWECIQRAVRRRARMQTFAEHAPGLAWSWLPDGSIDFVNRRWTEFTGLTLEQAKAGEHWGLVQSQDRKEFWRRFASARDGKRPFEMECRFRTGLGSGWRWFLVQGAPVVDAAGRIVRWVGTATDIDALKRGEIALRASEERFRRLFEESPLGVALEDEQGLFLRVNPAFCRMLGYEEASLLGMSLKTLTRDHHGGSERLLARRDGGVLWARVHEDAASRSKERFVLVEDLSGRKAAEQDRRLLVTVLENTPDFVGLARMDGTVFYVNPAGRRLVGLSSEQDAAVLGIESYGFPEDLPLYRFEVMPAVKRGEIWQGEIRFRHQGTGEPIPMEMRAFAIFDEQGRRLGFANVSRDIRERKAAESALRKSETDYRTLIQTLPHMVWMTTPAGVCDYLSPQWLAYTGIAQEQQLGEGWLQSLHPEDREPTRQAWATAVETQGRYDVEFRIRRHDGAHRWFKTRGVPQFDDSGQLVRWLGVCTDIHDQKSVEAALRRSNAELEQFAYVASHDLQEPLRTCTVYAQLLERRCAEVVQGEAKEFLNNVVQSSQRMRQLINDLLEYSRTGTDFATAIADPQAAVEAAMENLKERIRETKAVVTFQPMPTVMANQSQLAAVFQNLLSNSIKYARPGVPPEICIRTESCDGICQFSVWDNGSGFEPRYAEKIFGIFKRLHGQSVPGTGIGLAIVKNIVERHGGAAWAEGRPGEGATFYFTLPLA
ncbi:MAG: PAS domain S-box protein [Bryobacteraceae bacterium]|nr:PAS domain S-box protein [Bryobacteraceae bacterium]